MKIFILLGPLLGGLQTDHNFRNNGLDATFVDLGFGSQTGRPTDRGKFRVPSLRNIALTAPYMHDGRLTTLQAVLDHYRARAVRRHHPRPAHAQHHQRPLAAEPEPGADRAGENANHRLFAHPHRLRFSRTRALPSRSRAPTGPQRRLRS